MIEQEKLLIEAAQQDPRRFAELYEANFERVYPSRLRMAVPKALPSVLALSNNPSRRNARRQIRAYLMYAGQLPKGEA